MLCEPGEIAKGSSNPCSGRREGWWEREKGENYIYKVYGIQLLGIMVYLLILILMAFKILFSRDACFLLLFRRVDGL